MNAIDLLKAQHQEVKALFDQIEQTDADDEKQMIFEELADSLTAHTTIEEKLFYPAAYAKQTKELLQEAVEEHLAIKRVIADLLGMKPDHENFEAKIKVLHEQVEHHVEEEEGELFEKVREELGDKKLEKLGAQMKALFDEEMDDGPSEKVLGQLDEAAPLR